MKFRKKPVVVEAAQFDADKAHNLPEPFASAICRSWDDPSANLASLDYLHELGIAGTQRTFEVENRAANQHIHTLEGAHMVDDHDWIIRGVKGEFYPCKPDIFDMTYERVPE